MKKILAIAMLLVASVAYGQDRSGIYEVRGAEVQSDGKKVKYAGICILKKVSDKNHYVAQWTSVIGQNIVGFGYVRDGHLILAWSSGKATGINEYKLADGDKPYVGRWSQSGNAIWNEETLYFKCTLPKAEKEDDDVQSVEKKNSQKGRPVWPAYGDDLPQCPMPVRPAGTVQNLGIFFRPNPLLVS